jgi:hypothetical protein
VTEMKKRGCRCMFGDWVRFETAVVAFRAYGISRHHIRAACETRELRSRLCCGQRLVHKNEYERFLRIASPPKEAIPVLEKQSAAPRLASGVPD